MFILYITCRYSHLSRPIRNKNCLWWPCLLPDRDEMSNLYRGPSIDASYQVSVHLAKRFLRRRFLKISQSETRIACGGHVYDYLPWISDDYFFGNETIYGIKNTHIQQNRTDQPCGWVIIDNNTLEWRNWQKTILPISTKMYLCQRGPSIDHWR
jgi:hypothetical protein